MTDELDTYIKSVVAHPLICIRFAADTDLCLVLHVEENDVGQLVSIGMVPVRRSRGAGFITLNPRIVKDIFQPVITLVEVNNWFLEIRPLTEKIRVQKRPSGKYVCFYPFEKFNGQIRRVMVDGTPPPQLRMWFTIHATYQESSTSTPLKLEKQIDAPMDFTEELFESF
jgi:hypothetical protein